VLVTSTVPVKATVMGIVKFMAVLEFPTWTFEFVPLTVQFPPIVAVVLLVII
jgi:hypothetical protein